MDLRIFNAAMLVGWLLVLAGGVLINPGIGILCAGLLLIVLALLVSRIGGLYAKTEGED